MLTPLKHHELLLFWVQILLLFTTARGFGLLAQRFGQPAVVGELAAGLVLGPSVFGRLLPQAAHWLFPGDPHHSGIILAVAWVGVILLLIETGFETDLGLLASIGRSTAMVPLGSLLLPLGLGIGLGFLMPDVFLTGGRTIFALFMGVCLAVSSLPVVAKILLELRLMRRNVGQVIIVAGMADDLVGWIMLSTLAGAATAGHLQVGKLVTTVAALAAFIVLAFTMGQKATNGLLRHALKASDGIALPMSAVMLVVFLLAAITQAIGIEAVFGAFVAGIIIARSRYFRRDIEAGIHAFSHAVFAPIFFATAGMFVDLGQLAKPTIALWAGVVIAVASVGKLVGSYVGARLGPLSHHEALAVGIGLNARGALEIIIATIALSIGVFNQQAYTVIVLLAMTTSIMAPPLLRWVLASMEASPQEAERLEREEVLEASVIANSRSALLPTRGGANSVMAARVLDLVLQREAHVTILHVEPPHDFDRQTRESFIALVQQTFGERGTERREEDSEDPITVILQEARLGYDLVALGLNEDFQGTHELSPRLQGLLANSPAPILLVRRGMGLAAGAALRYLRFRRVLVPITGTMLGRAAEEIGYTIASRLEAEVDVVHVISRPDRGPDDAELFGVGQLNRARSLAKRFGRGASPVLRVGATAYEEIIAAADDRGADLIVLGAQVRAHDDRPFLGHGTEFVLEHARQTVVVAVFPERGTASNE